MTFFQSRQCRAIGLLVTHQVSLKEKVMLTVLGDALNVAARRNQTPLPKNDWADRFVPESRKTEGGRPERINVYRHLRW